jgi:hypothetical protein
VEGVLCLEGLIFIKKNVIRRNDEIVKKTFSELYKYVSFN